MGQVGYLILAISILVGLLAIFIVSFIAYVRTPAPKGIKNKKACSSCSNKACQFYKEEKKD